MKKELWKTTTLIMLTVTVIYVVGFYGINATRANDNIRKLETQKLETQKLELQKLEHCLSKNPSNKLENNSLCNNPTQQRIKSIPNPPSSLINVISQKRFLKAISHNLAIIPEANSFEHILLRSYGSAYVNRQPGIKLPQKVIFANEKETKDFQATLTMGKVNRTRNCYLQKPAADALNRARARVRIPMMSRNGHINCTRSFRTTVRLWNKYANNRTLEKVRQGQETKILGIVAPPGTSQHLWGLAVDLRVTKQAQKRALNQNGWYRTVKNDTPHWTYLGYSSEELAALGFKNKVIKGINYWLTPL